MAIRTGVQVTVVPTEQTLEGGGFPIRRPFPVAGRSHFDPILLVDEMGPVDYGPGEAVGAPDHPHRGFETVTYLIDGAMEHEDSHGHRGTLRSGDVQWMTAGAGVIHSEMPARAILDHGGRVHGFQIWVNLPRALKMSHPRYQEYTSDRLPVIAGDGSWIRVIAGEVDGQRSPIETTVPATMLHLKLDPYANAVVPVPAGANAIVHTIAGSADVAGTNVADHHVALIEQSPATLAIVAGASGYEALVIAAMPLGEPVARYGPFVMNTRAELEQAFADYQAGRFGEIAPRQLALPGAAARRSGATPEPAHNVSEERSEPKVVLLVRLLSAIDEGRFGFEELKARIADDKPPSTRSLRRYLAVLSDAGFPWYFDRAAGTYRFADGYSLRRLNLSQRELLGLVTLKRLGSSLGGTLAGYIEETTAKLLQSSDPRSTSAMHVSSLAIRLESVALEPHVEQLFETLQAAERDHRRVRFDYTDKNGTRTQRRVDPYGFIVSNGRIYLVAYDHARTDMRVFAVDNIDAVHVQPQTFERPADFNLDAYGANSVSGVRHGGELTDVTVRFSPIVAKAASAASVARDRRIERRSDGSIDITYRVADPLEIVRWSLSWGTEGEVIAPPSARASARTLAQALSRTYESA